MFKFAGVFFCFLSAYCGNAQVRYEELYRPQYHASPSSGFMGDPNGPLKFQGKYHLFWWGHLRSDDMVYWTEINKNALTGTPGGYGNWSGSVVVDTGNTAGFGTNGNPAMVAVYTLHENATGIQRQAISYSNTYSTFQYYPGNPVLNTNEKDFRDPQVFWHQGTQKWVMVVARPIERAVRIYSSPDLKVWTLESTFKGRGAVKEVWEVPDLIEIPLNGDENNKKWVMICGMGPNKEQFWVGNFDGKTFTLDPEDNLLTGKQVPGELFADFEAGFNNWIVEGEAFGNAPAGGTLPGQQDVNGFTGYGYANSYHNGDDTKGKLISPDFVISKRHINFQIGGGAVSGVGVKLIVDGVEKASVTSTTSIETLRWRGIDVSQWIGKTAHIEIVDNAAGSWGHVLADHFVFSDVLYDTRIENANWADWGYDFYAAKTFRNYDYDEKRTVWLAWMGNWTYAQSVPTSPWKGCQTVPRELQLINQGHGYQLLQKPIPELEKLRTDSFAQSNLTVDGILKIDSFKPTWNVYEMKISFRVENKNQRFGINLAENGTRKIVVEYDAATSNLYVRRPINGFSFAYQSESITPILLPVDNILDLHIFLDQSSVEILACNNAYSVTNLSFSDSTSVGISLFSVNGPVEVKTLDAWLLESIWGVLPPLPPEPPEEPEIGETPYPNPVASGGQLHSGLFENALSVDICDALGRRLASISAPADTKITLPPDIRNGVYFLNLKLADKQVTKKIVVQ